MATKKPTKKNREFKEKITFYHGSCTLLHGIVFRNATKKQKENERKKAEAEKREPDFSAESIGRNSLYPVLPAPINDAINRRFDMDKSDDHYFFRLDFTVGITQDEKWDIFFFSRHRPFNAWIGREAVIGRLLTRDIRRINCVICGKNVSKSAGSVRVADTSDWFCRACFRKDPEEYNRRSFERAMGRKLGEHDCEFCGKPMDRCDDCGEYACTSCESGKAKARAKPCKDKGGE